jgi:hypothetical protein
VGGHHRVLTALLRRLTLTLPIIDAGESLDGPPIDLERPSPYKPAHARAGRPAHLLLRREKPEKLLLHSDSTKKGRTPRYRKK